MHLDFPILPISILFCLPDRYSLQENRDPHRYTELYEFLLDNPICGDGGASGDAGYV